MTSTRDDRAQLDPDALAALEEERDFLLRSIDDLEREHDAGDIDDHDYHQLSDGYVARTAEVLRAIDERRIAFVDAKRTTSLTRKVLTVGGVLLVGVLAGVLVAHYSGRRTVNDEITGAGKVPLTTTQQANECVSDTTANAMGKAVTCFQKVLNADPTNPTALTYLGWTLVLSSASLPQGTAAQAIGAGQAFVDKAIKSDPTFPDAWAFKAIIAEKLDQPTVARAALDKLATLSPPAEITSLVSGLSAQVDQELASTTTTTTAPKPGTPTTTVPETTTTATP